MVLPIITIEDEDYARSAFVAGMQGNGVLIEPDQITVCQRRDGNVTCLMCMAESPDRRVNPYARGVFYGNASGGKIHILEYYDQESNWWKKPEPKLAWHYFTGTIGSILPETMPAPIKTRQQPLLDVWFDPSV